MRPVRINREIFRDKVMGCWLGKNAGGTLGEPLEGKFGQKEMFHVDWYPSLPEGGIPNDDLELQLIWFQKLKEKGPGITSADLVESWMDCVSYNFDEYGLCKENMQKGLLPPVSGWHNNAFKDCMGSPIRSEIWACICPGAPERAAWYAFQDAIVDHGGGESVYGEIFNAVLESCAFVNSDKFELLKAALSAIPKSSRTFQCVKKSIDNYHAGMGYEANRNDLVEHFYHPVAQYSPLNLGFQTIGWLYGEDFGDAICKAVNCGWDTDCTAATLGAVLGIIGGASALPQKWIEPLGYEIATNMTTGGIRNLTAPTNIRELTTLVCQEAENVARYWNSGICFTDAEPMSRNMVLHVEKPDFLDSYEPNGIAYSLGGLKETVCYEEHAAILGDRSSKISLWLENPHPEEKEAEVSLELPEGFSCSRDGEILPENMSAEESIRLRIPAGEKVILRYEISADPEKIHETNLCWFRIRIKGEPVIPAVPVVLTGGRRWMVSELFEDRTLDDDCGICEEQIFLTAPEGWKEQWNPGNDLQVSGCFEKDKNRKSGIVYALHQIYSEEDRKVVLGVPNNGYMKLFLNGQMIHRTKEKVPLRANLGNGGALGDLSNYVVTELKKGWNQILIKMQSDGAESEPYMAHFTVGGMSDVCVKNHGMPVMGLIRSRFIWGW